MQRGRHGGGGLKMGSWGGMGAGYRVYEGGMRGVYVRGKGKLWGGGGIRGNTGVVCRASHQRSYDAFVRKTRRRKSAGEESVSAKRRRWMSGLHRMMRRIVMITQE